MGSEGSSKAPGAPRDGGDRGQRGAVSLLRRLGPPLIAPIAIVAAMAGVVGLFKFRIPPLGEEATQVQAEAESQTQEAATQPATGMENAYTGVEDPWMMSGYFTVGNEDFDHKVKTFCDAFSGDTSSSVDAAHALYNNIIWGNFSAREDGSKPYGRDWVIVSARIYFDTADPENGETGDGDFYEWSAALAFCMRYFGYSDAIAVPTITYDEYGNAIYSAICYLTGSDGRRYLLDPALGVNGWMVDASTREILVDNIGQDISVAESYGLTVVSSEDLEGVEGQNAAPEGVDAGGEYGAVDEYGTVDEYGLEDEYVEEGAYDEYGAYEEEVY